jgi:hypothetical protein
MRLRSGAVEWKASLSETKLIVPHSRIASFEARMFFEPDIDAFVRAVSGFPWIEFFFLVGVVTQPARKSAVKSRKLLLMTDENDSDEILTQGGKSLTLDGAPFAFAISLKCTSNIPPSAAPP